MPFYRPSEEIISLIAVQQRIQISSSLKREISQVVSNQLRSFIGVWRRDIKSKTTLIKADSFVDNYQKDLEIYFKNFFKVPAKNLQYLLKRLARDFFKWTKLNQADASEFGLSIQKSALLISPQKIQTFNFKAIENGKTINWQHN